MCVISKALVWLPDVTNIRSVVASAGAKAYDTVALVGGYTYGR